jgi:deaminated glutathione amidase
MEERRRAAALVKRSRKASSTLRIAAAQFPVSGDIARNARYIRSQLAKAALQGAHVIQFPETALSGYAPKHWKRIAKFPWDTLAEHTTQVLELASRHRIWVVLGSMRRTRARLPTSCLHVISDRGEIAATYDKQRLYGSEKRMFSAGRKPCVVSIRGHKCGFLICYDNCFPELYEPYREAGVGLLFHSFYNASNARPTSIKDLMLANLLVRAADNRMWIAASNSSASYSPLAACIVRPDGTSVRARRHVPGFALDEYPSLKLGWTYDNRAP